jgi:hypothetical protein
VPPVGLGRWTALGAAVVDAPTAAQTMVSDLEPGANGFVWQIDLGACPQAASDTVWVFRETAPLARDDRYFISPANDQTLMNVLLNDAVAGTVDPVVAAIDMVEAGLLELPVGGNNFLYTADPLERRTVEFRYTVCAANSSCAFPCDTALVTIEMLERPVVPDALVTGADNANGYLEIRGLGDLVAELLITDRWGDVVYRSRAYDNSDPWRGEYRGEGRYLPEGAYYYFMKVFDQGRQVGDTATGVIHLFHQDK